MVQRRHRQSYRKLFRAAHVCTQQGYQRGLASGRRQASHRAGRLYASAVFDADTDTYIVKIVNINKEAAPFEIILDKLPKKAVLGSVECVAMGPTSDPRCQLLFGRYAWRICNRRPGSGETQCPTFVYCGSAHIRSIPHSCAVNNRPRSGLPS